MFFPSRLIREREGPSYREGEPLHGTELRGYVYVEAAWFSAVLRIKCRVCFHEIVDPNNPPIIIIDHANRYSSQEAERLLPGSLTYRTYGYLMVAYAVENQWGAAIDLATVRVTLIVPSGFPCFDEQISGKQMSLKEKASDNSRL